MRRELRRPRKGQEQLRSPVRRAGPSPEIWLRPPPNACDARTLTEESVAKPKTSGTASNVFANAPAASGVTPRRPTMIASASPISIWPTKPATIGSANAKVRRFSKRARATIDMKKHRVRKGTQDRRVPYADSNPPAIRGSSWQPFTTDWIPWIARNPL